MSYVLDTYLPSTPGRFLEQSSNASLYGNDNTLYNSFFVIQNFLAETYGKPVKTDFTDLSDYKFFNGNSAGNPLSIAGRELLFASILTDVATRQSTTQASLTPTLLREHIWWPTHSFLSQARTTGKTP